MSTITKKLVLHRRTVLRGILGGAAIGIALPPLEAMMNPSGTAYAGGAAIPKRFGVFYWGNGVLPSRYSAALERIRTHEQPG